GWRDYVTLTKPRIMSLLLITGLGAMFVGARGAPSAWLAVVTITGLALACGGASALNHVLDQDIDKLMGARTRARPLAAERMPAGRGVRETTRQIVLYALILVAVTVVPVVWGPLGAVYLGAALGLGAAFVLLALRLRRETTPRHASQLFHYSLLYLALLFVAM